MLDFPEFHMLDFPEFHMLELHLKISIFYIIDFPQFLMLHSAQGGIFLKGRQHFKNTSFDGRGAEEF